MQSLCLVFLYSFSGFGLALILGGQQWSTLEVEIYTLVAHELALAPASILALFSLILLSSLLLLLLYFQGLFLKPQKENLNSFSHRLINKLNSWYLPVIKWALHNTKKVLYSAVGLLFLAIALFSSMGGEFIPQLDEGDFVIQPVLKTGTSLSKTIETTTKIEKVILKNFPEAEQVVSRIGAAEVPTDPMSMEESDVIIKLKPKSEWVSADSKDELADKIKTAIEKQIPNMEIEFTQPIEMRFNELISGSRSDVAIKIFGEDLDILAKKAQEVEKAILANSFHAHRLLHLAKKYVSS